jgi:RNA polymerase sigma factor (sigma-70 family)
LHPPALHLLLNGVDGASREAAWEALVAEHSRLLLHIARSLFVHNDSAMDAYAFVLERLHEDDYRRLRGFVADGRSLFSTWLMVVATRLCLDFYRRRYGRARGAPNDAHAAGRREARRQLMDLVVVDTDVTTIADPNSYEPDRFIREEQLAQALEATLAELSPEDRLIVKLRYEDGLTAQEIARVIGWRTPFHVFRRLNLTYTRLRRALQSRGVESSIP